MRTIRMMRLYNLGNYSNVTFEDIIEIPTEKEYDLDYINKVQKLQMATIDLQYYKYAQLQESVKRHTTNLDEAIQMLTEAKLNLIDDIFNKQIDTEITEQKEEN